MAISDILGGILPDSSLISIFIYGFLALVIFGSIAAAVYFLVYKKRKWFLNVEFKIPRSDGKFMNAEWGKGTYDAERGVVFVKRSGKKPVPMKPFDIKRYLQGTDILTVVQIGIEDYRPVLQDSYIEMEDEQTGEEAALIKAKIDTSESKAWRSSFEREAKAAYSIIGLLHQYAHFVGFGILFFMIFAGFAVLYGRIG